MSPSEFANKAADGTARNACRDLWSKRPRDRDFRLADAAGWRCGTGSTRPLHLRDCALALIRRKGLKPKPAREAFAANPRAASRAVLTA